MKNVGNNFSCNTNYRRKGNISVMNNTHLRNHAANVRETENEKSQLEAFKIGTALNFLVSTENLSADNLYVELDLGFVLFSRLRFATYSSLRSRATGIFNCSRYLATVLLAML